ncbi:hypothetical protein WISP_31187 [Willisornis vidua]|uniref:Uncharacterized protein n=1 Tax=Willisornis vidua TaxID=1566151 RepID=A0ABQ9DKQ1_9PASS|nr:hypothetical protein WISP_31187 [Willisornis vidua]
MNHPDDPADVELPVYQVLAVASCPIAWYHQEEPGSILLAPSLQILIDIGKIKACGNIEVQRGLLPELDFCIAIGKIFGSDDQALFCCTKVTMARNGWLASTLSNCPTLGGLEIDCSRSKYEK